MPTTIQDVAQKAGVSVATVSRVINNSPAVSEKARNNVMQAIEELDYRPNLLGRNLRRTETRLILVLLPSISNPFYSKVVKGIESVARENGYNILLCNTDSQLETEKAYLKLLKSRLSDGVIFMAPELDREELSAIGRSFSVVQCCEYKEDAQVSHVSIDNFSAAYRAVQYLIGLGHKKIGMITCNNNFISTIQRNAGYKKAIEDVGLVYDTSLIKQGNYSFKSGIRAGRQFLLKKDNIPTAVFAISDSMAIGAIRCFREKGLKVPEDISIIGFDDITYASMCEPMLTTISQPQFELGCEAMELLLMQMRGEVIEPRSIFLDYELIIRESTGKPS
ncbi:MAG TPA: LacI family DNA-binding transcriptional regulator [Clostridiales bacterium]|nr:LacI family DNA-binding transcriptional regulator [Clostridiales bacterium]